jgi:hypothetical protein
MQVQLAVSLSGVQLEHNKALESCIMAAAASPVLASAAFYAVKQWNYLPYLLNGEAVEVETQYK